VIGSFFASDNTWAPQEAWRNWQWHVFPAVRARVMGSYREVNNLPKRMAVGLLSAPHQKGVPARTIDAEWARGLWQAACTRLERRPLTFAAEGTDSVVTTHTARSGNLEEGMERLASGVEMRAVSTETTSSPKHGRSPGLFEPARGVDEQACGSAEVRKALGDGYAGGYLATLSGRGSRHQSPRAAVNSALSEGIVRFSRAGASTTRLWN
jgi:hypothetical protein